MTTITTSIKEEIEKAVEVTMVTVMMILTLHFAKAPIIKEEDLEIIVMTMMV